MRRKKRVILIMDFPHYSREDFLKKKLEGLYEKKESLTAKKRSSQRLNKQILDMQNMLQAMAPDFDD